MGTGALSGGNRYLLQVVKAHLSGPSRTAPGPRHAELRVCTGEEARNASQEAALALDCYAVVAYNPLLFLG